MPPTAIAAMAAARPRRRVSTNFRERVQRPWPASCAWASAWERSSSSSGELACSPNNAQSCWMRFQASAWRGSSASQADSSGQPSRSISASRTRQAAACVRQDVSLSLMPVPFRQVNRCLNNVFLDGALPYAVQGSNIFLLHILEPEQNKNLTGELAQFLE